MKKLISVIAAVVLCCIFLSQGMAGEKIRGVASVAKVSPRVIPMLAKLPKLDESRLPADQTDGHMTRPELFDIPAEEFERLAEQPPPAYDGKARLTIDRSAQQPSSGTGVRSATNANLGINFEGNAQGGSRPGDPMTAVGPLNVVSTANSTVRIRAKTGGAPTTWTAQVFLGAVFGGFDPKVEYDIIGQRFIMLFDDQNGRDNATYYVGISQTSDAMGGWYVYSFDMTLDGSTPTTHWADFPGLGYDNNSIYMTGNMYNLKTNPNAPDSFFYVKTRVLDKNAMYLGLPTGYTDIIDIPGPGRHFTMKPAQCLSPSDTGYLAVHPNGGGSQLQLYRIVGGPGAPVLENIGNPNVSAFGVPPGGTQQSCPQTTVDAGDARTQDPVWRNGILYLANQEGITLNSSPVCAIGYYKVRTSPLSVVTDEIYAAPGEFYLYPGVTVDAWGTAFFTFSRMSASEYASGAYTVKRLTDTSMEPSTIMKGGLSSYWCTSTGDRKSVV